MGRRDWRVSGGEGGRGKAVRKGWVPRARGLAAGNLGPRADSASCAPPRAGARGAHLKGVERENEAARLPRRREPALTHDQQQGHEHVVPHGGCGREPSLEAKAIL
jgi:hypothetical protein